jgi:hypothetical protein
MKELENGAHEFPIKHLNIVDPLKSSNNLGRSVNKGMFNSIDAAVFGYCSINLELKGLNMVSVKFGGSDFWEFFLYSMGTFHGDME